MEAPLEVAATRKWRMIRLRDGDYLLPSNDRKTLWRITRYEEDGSAEVSADGKAWRKLKGTFWAVAKYERPFTSLAILNDPDFLDWGDHWLHWEHLLPTRQAAINATLRYSE